MKPIPNSKIVFANFGKSWFSDRNIYLLLIGLGIAIRIVQYIYNRSFYLDEASLALGLIDLKNSVFEALPHSQVAPVLFLMIERGFIFVFGNNEYALRAFPFICSLLSVPLFKGVAEQISKNKRVTQTALFIFAFSPLAILYSSALKQYSSDLLVFLILTFFALRKIPEKQKYFWLTVAGIISIFLSNVSVLILFYIYVLLFINHIVETKINLYFIGSSVFLLIAFSINYFLFIHNHPLRQFMLNYWEYAFMPLNPFKVEFWKFLAESFSMFFKKLFFGQATPGVFITGYVGLLFVFFMGGILKAIKNKNYLFLYLTLFPIVLHLILSAFKIYPFHNRLILYLAPVVLILISTGIHFLNELIQNKIHKKLPYFINVILLAGFLVPFSMNFPVEKEEIKQSMKYMEEHYIPGDKIIVYEDAAKQFYYYLETGLFDFDKNNVIYTENIQEMESQFSAISTTSKKAWFIFSHYLNQSEKEMEQLKDDLTKMGDIIYLKESTGSMVFKVQAK